MGKAYVRNEIWDVNTLSWIKQTAGGGGGGDASEATLATRLADATFTGRIGEVQASPTANTVLARLKTIGDAVTGAVVVSGPLTDTQLRATPVPVSGTFFQATQPVSAASLPLPTDAATESTLSALNTKVTAVNTGAVVVSSSALPSGAATLVEQQTQSSSLASIAAEDFATEATLTSVLAQLASLLQTQGNQVSGMVGPLILGKVSDTPESYTEGAAHPFSITTEGRIRVSSIQAHLDMEFFSGGNPLLNLPALTSIENPWEVGKSHPWS